MAFFSKGVILGAARQFSADVERRREQNEERAEDLRRKIERTQTSTENILARRRQSDQGYIQSAAVLLDSYGGAKASELKEKLSPEALAQFGREVESYTKIKSSEGYKPNFKAMVNSFMARSFTPEGKFTNPYATTKPAPAKPAEPKETPSFLQRVGQSLTGSAPVTERRAELAEAESQLAQARTPAAPQAILGSIPGKLGQRDLNELGRRLTDSIDVGILDRYENLTSESVYEAIKKTRNEKTTSSEEKVRKLTALKTLLDKKVFDEENQTIAGQALEVLSRPENMANGEIKQEILENIDSKGLSQTVKELQEKQPAQSSTDTEVKSTSVQDTIPEDAKKQAVTMEEFKEQRGGQNVRAIVTSDPDKTNFKYLEFQKGGNFYVISHPKYKAKK